MTCIADTGIMGDIPLGSAVLNLTYHGSMTCIADPGVARDIPLGVSRPQCDLSWHHDVHRRHWCHARHPPWGQPSSV
eukprot:1161481-Pelagomonas_calceolata.AAC.4